MLVLRFFKPYINFLFDCLSINTKAYFIPPIPTVGPYAISILYTSPTSSLVVSDNVVFRLGERMVDVSPSFSSGFFGVDAMLTDLLETV